MQFMLRTRIADIRASLRSLRAPSIQEELLGSSGLEVYVTKRASTLACDTTHTVVGPLSPRSTAAKKTRQATRECIEKAARA